MSAALILARCRRSVLVFDTGRQRNIRAEHMHGYLSRDGIAPADFLELARRELKGYGVEIRHKEVVDVKKENNLFFAIDDKGNAFSGRKMLLATGIKDNIPDIEGVDELYGKSIHHCPYCDGWENRDKAIAVYGKGKGGTSLALALKNWSADVVLCTDGPGRLLPQHCDELARKGVPIITEKIRRLKGSQGRLEAVVFESGKELKRDALFFSTGFRQHSDLAAKLECRFKRKREIWVDHIQQSSVEGLYVSGDAAYEMKLVVIAVGEGAKAAVAINTALLYEEDLRPKDDGAVLVQTDSM